MNSEAGGSFFERLTTHYQALAMIRDTSKAFSIIGGLQLVYSAFLGGAGLVDGILNVAGAYAIRKSHSRGAAVILLLLSIITFVLVALKFSGVHIPIIAGGSSLIFALVGLWAGVRATEATFKLHGSLSSNFVPVQSIDENI